MSDEITVLITVAFPPTEEEINGKTHKHPGYGHKYLFTTNLIPFPTWEDDDERWLSWSEERIIKKRFIKWFENRLYIHGRKFDGQILFIDPANDIIVANAKGNL